MRDQLDGCTEFDLRVLDSVFAPAPDAELDRHLSTCPRCTRARRHYLRTSDALNAVFSAAPAGAASSGMGARGLRTLALAAAVLLAGAALLVGLLADRGLEHGEIRAGSGTFVATRAMSVVTPLGIVEADQATFRVTVEQAVAVTVAVDEGEVRWHLREGEEPVRIVAGEQLRRIVLEKGSARAGAAPPAAGPAVERESAASSELPTATVRLAGVVRERATAAPVADLSIEARREPEGPGLAEARTDADGRFQLELPREPPEWLLVHEERARGLSELKPTPLVLARVDLAGSDDTGALQLEFPWNGRIAGSVVDRAGSAVPGAHVRALTASFLWMAPGKAEGAHPLGAATDGIAALADQSGNFMLRQVPNDRALMLLVEAEGYAAAVTAPLRPPFAPGLDRVAVTLDPEARIDGIVRDASGQAVEDALVGARRSGIATWSPSPVRTDPSGKFTLRGLPAGRYSVQALGSQVNAIAGDVSLAAGGTAHVLLTPPEVLIEGVVVDASGAPFQPAAGVPMFVVALQLDAAEGVQGESLRVDVDADGSFRFAPIYGRRYRMYATTRTPGDAVEPLDFEAPASGVRLPWSELPRVPLAIEARAVETGAPLAAASAHLRWDGAGRVIWFDESGQRTEMVRARKYDLTLCARGRAPERATLEVGPEGHDAVFALAPGRVVSGIVRDASGQPAAGVQVAVEFAGDLQANMSTSAFTDAEGRFAIDSAPPQGGALGVLDAAGSLAARVPISAGELEIRIQ